MTARGLWARLLGLCVCAATLVAAASPEPPPTGLRMPEAVVVGVLCGIALFHAQSRLPFPVPLGVAATLAAVAAAEELIWRWFILAELATRVGAVPALAASSLAFGAVHPGRRLQHTASGLAFGGVYLGTGSLAAAWGAHLTYNLAVAAAARRAPPTAA